MKEEADDGEQGKGSNRTFMELKCDSIAGHL